jgi:HSP20 family protein
VEVKLDRGVLTIAGERPPICLRGGGKAAVHINERFGGRFRRVISLSDDVDPNGVSATYRDGILHITAKRRESAQPAPHQRSMITERAMNDTTAVETRQQDFARG